MPPRPRKHSRRNWPDNLTWDRHNRRYVYRRPDTGVRRSLGSDQQDAFTAARRLNELLMPNEARRVSDSVSRVLGEGEITIAALRRRFWAEHIEPKGMAQGTLDGYRQMLNVIEQEFGVLHPADMTTRRAAEFLDRFPPRQSNRYRNLLHQFFRWIVAKGYLEDEPIGTTLPKRYRVTRQRLDLDGFYAIREHAEPWLQNAMDLALHTLQRREDLVEMRFDQIEGDTLPVVQRKTGAHVLIDIGEELAAVIRRSRLDGVVSPYIIHRRPQRIRRKGVMRTKGHHTQLVPRQLSDAFADARESSGHYAHLTRDERPTLHEIRALGAKLYEDAGVDPQPLLGHRDPETTRVYLDRHKVEWLRARAGLKLG